MERVSRELERLRHTAALALDCIDAGRYEEARRHLASALEPVFQENPEPSDAAIPWVTPASAALASDGPWAPLGEGELEQAFEVAEPELDGMLDANRVAESALADADAEPELELSPDWIVAEDSPFATETMAGLLERQGHAGEARAIRDGLDARAIQDGLDTGARAEEADAPARGAARRAAVIAELERWLARLETRKRKAA